MNLRNLIRELSLADTKSLGQKALKASEEVGELAKVVLPFENAFACRHKFVDKKAILEEVADVILTVQSIAYSLDFNDDDLEEMLKDKALYWAELQKRDLDAKFPLPYEIHITVSGELDLFLGACQRLGIKPVYIENQDQKGRAVFSDLMTSVVHRGDNLSVWAEMSRIEKGLSDFTIIRKKIETVPWHPAAPSIKHQNPKMPPNCYFESHLSVYVDSDNINKFRKVAAENNCHTSINVLKQNKIMTTLRRYSGTIEEFKTEADQIKNNIQSAGFEVDRVITEFSLFDSLVSHDYVWLNT